jgi:hypothetical protein
MKLVALALFAFAGLARADSVTVDNSGPGMCFPTSLISGEGTDQVTMVAFVDFPGTIPIQTTTCTLTVIADLMTDGPERPGFLRITPFQDPDEVGGSLFLDGTLLVSCFRGCHTGTSSGNLMIPVTLGQSFEITEVATGFNGGDNSPAAEIDARIQALDDGFPVTISEGSPPPPVPEPPSLTLTLAGLGALWWHLRKFPNRGTGSAH